MYKSGGKRMFDLLVSSVAIVLLSPIFLLIILALSLANRGSIFFIQPRVGLNLRVFKVVKFKTMNDLKDKEGNLLPDDKRLTSIGRFVRASSMDELPQLFNVLRGQMSLIGPRPLLVQYIPLYDAFQNRRHDVRPGITGWAQVNGRNAIEWAQKFELDVYYVDHLSFLLDLRIMIMTVQKVFKSEGISASNHATMEFFKGNDQD